MLLLQRSFKFKANFVFLILHLHQDICLMLEFSLKFSNPPFIGLFFCCKSFLQLLQRGKILISQRVVNLNQLVVFLLEAEHLLYHLFTL